MYLCPAISYIFILWMYLFFLQVHKCMVNISSSNDVMIVYVTQGFAFGSVFSVDVPPHYL